GTEGWLEAKAELQRLIPVEAQVLAYNVWEWAQAYREANTGGADFRRKAEARLEAWLCLQQPQKPERILMRFLCESPARLRKAAVVILAAQGSLEDLVIFGHYEHGTQQEPRSPRVGLCMLRWHYSDLIVAVASLVNRPVIAAAYMEDVFPLMNILLQQAFQREGLAAALVTLDQATNLYAGSIDEMLSPALPPGGELDISIDLVSLLRADGLTCFDKSQG
ncbi:hypothetical protein IWQ60_007049, partial [Tieghemiomyces parasiticus]